MHDISGCLEAEQKIERLQKELDDERQSKAAFGNTILELEKELSEAKAEVDVAREAIEDLIGIAESYAMQTYDRSGVTRRSINKAKEALGKEDGR